MSQIIGQYDLSDRYRSLAKVKHSVPALPYSMERCRPTNNVLVTNGYKAILSEARTKGKPKPWSKNNFVSNTTGTYRSIKDQLHCAMVPIDSMNPYQALSNTKPLLDHHHDYWWHLTGRPLAVMLEHAEYDSNAQYRYLIFYREFILPSLGLAQSPDTKPMWQSFMTDNGTPIELSLCWNEKGVVSVKFSIEPVGKQAGTSSDPMNLQQTTSFMESMREIQSERHDLQWFRALEEGIYGDQSVLQRYKQPPRNRCSESYQIKPAILRGCSQYFTAVDLLADHTIVKAYVIPELEAERTKCSKHELANRAVLQIGGPILRLWNEIQKHLSSMQEAQGTSSEVEMLSVDCLKPEESRLKVYFRTRNTSFQAIKRLLLLGGWLENHIPKTTLDVLAQLWQEVLGLPVNNSNNAWESAELPHVDHRTAGVLFYYEMRNQYSVPWPKVYIPVRHYSKNDEVVAIGIENFMASHKSTFGQWSQQGKYRQTLKHAFAVEELSESRGLHTYVTFAIKPAGWEMHSYFNPGWRRNIE